MPRPMTRRERAPVTDWNDEMAGDSIAAADTIPFRDEALESVQDELASAEAEVTKLRGELKDLKADLDDAQTELAAAHNKIKLATEAVELIPKLTTELQRAVDTIEAVAHVLQSGGTKAAALEALVKYMPVPKASEGVE